MSKDASKRTFLISPKIIAAATGVFLLVLAISLIFAALYISKEGLSDQNLTYYAGSSATISTLGNLDLALPSLPPEGTIFTASCKEALSSDKKVETILVIYRNNKVVLEQISSWHEFEVDKEKNGDVFNIIPTNRERKQINFFCTINLLKE